MMDSAASTDKFKPFTTYSPVNKFVIGIVICCIACVGAVFFAAAFRQGLGKFGSEEAFLGTTGLAFIFLSYHSTRFILSPRILIDQDFVLLSDFYRKRKFSYNEVRAFAEFVRKMPIRFNRNRCLDIPVLAIRLHSGKLIQMALPNSRNIQSCLNALSKASGLSIESLGVDPPNVQEWQRAVQ